MATNSPVYRADSPDCAADWKMSKLRVSLCRKNGSDRDLNELPEIAILRPFRSGIQVRIPEIIGSWVRRRRAKVDVRLVARNAVCAPEFDIARASRLSEHLPRRSQVPAYRLLASRFWRQCLCALAEYGFATWPESLSSTDLFHRAFFVCAKKKPRDE